MDKAALKNYNQEVFPDNTNQLIAKCEETIIKINDRFASPNCILVKDLYNNNTSERTIDFLEKLAVTCNSKLHKNVKSQNELQGLYVFGEQKKDAVIPVYIGISRTVFRRLRQHVWGKKHNEATLAYLQAKTRLGHEKERLHMDTAEFMPEQEKIKNYKLVVIPEANHYDLYFMEVYIAGRLKTYWNSFKTH